MCGIFGYIGNNQDAVPMIIEGLRRLEYRGYDSAGVVVLNKEGIHINKCTGKVADLECLYKKDPIKGPIALGHTRWATHGGVTEMNSHPHTDQSGDIAIIHNGIIENYDIIKRSLQDKGHVFKSETDTEVLAHLIGTYYAKINDIYEAVRQALKDVEGAYAIGVICKKEPDKIIVAKKHSPLVVGVGEHEVFIASDAPAFIKHTNKVVYMEDYEIGVLTRDSVKFTDPDGVEKKKQIAELTFDSEQIEKGEYPHFMLKEIFEQPYAIQDTLQGRISKTLDGITFDEMKLTDQDLLNVEQITFVSCGTSWHAALVGEYFIERYAKVPTVVEYAAEFRYREPLVSEKNLVIAISQSGETADTLAAIAEAKSRKSKVLAICNVEGSSIVRESDAVIYTYAGPEIGVASTKAFTTQLVVLYLFSIYLGLLRKTLTKDKAREMIEQLRQLPNKIQQVLGKSDAIRQIAMKYVQKKNALYLGRGVGFPIALEGALKLKEISYVHAEGYSAAEMKHGPIALIDNEMPTVVLAFRGRRYDKIIGNIMEVKARHGKVIGIATEGNEDLADKVDDIIYIPHTTEMLSSLLASIPLQLFAYYIAVAKGCNVDQPRNLAKSVTVE